MLTAHKNKGNINKAFLQFYCTNQSEIFLFLSVLVASPLVSGGVRTVHDNKVSGQLSNNSSNHNARPGSNEDYLNMVPRLGNEVILRNNVPQ